MEHKSLIQAKMRGFSVQQGDLSLELLFCFKKAKGASKNKYSAPIGDIDNYCKSVMDALEGVLYENDRQVCELKAKKMYAEKEAIFIILKRIK